MMIESIEQPLLHLRNTSKGDAEIAYFSHGFKGANASGGNNKATILLCGGFHSNMRGSKAEYLKEFCQKEGFYFCRFDYQGHGDSSGEFAEGTIGTWFEDALAILDHQTKGPVIIVGSSMGGWMALLLSKYRTERVKGLLLLAPAPDFPEKLMWPLMNEDIRSEIETNGVWYRPSEFEGEGSYPITKALMDESRAHNLLDGEIPFHGPVHILHGSEDEVVPVEHAFKVCDALASKDVTVEVLKGGDHRLSNPTELHKIGMRLKELSQKCG